MAEAMEVAETVVVATEVEEMVEVETVEAAMVVMEEGMVVEVTVAAMAAVTTEEETEVEMMGVVTMAAMMEAAAAVEMMDLMMGPTLAIAVEMMLMSGLALIAAAILQTIRIQSPVEAGIIFL